MRSITRVESSSSAVAAHELFEREDLARVIPTPSVSVCRVSQRKQWLAKLEGGTRVRTTSLLTQLDMLLELRPKAKAAMIGAARRQPGWKTLRSIPFLRPCERP